MSDLHLTGCFALLNRHLLNLKVSGLRLPGFSDSAGSPTKTHNSHDFEGLEGDAEDVQRLWKGLLIESGGEPSPARYTHLPLRSG